MRPLVQHPRSRNLPHKAALYPAATKVSCSILREPEPKLRSRAYIFALNRPSEAWCTFLAPTIYTLIIPTRKTHLRLPNPNQSLKKPSSQVLCQGPGPFWCWGPSSSAPEPGGQILAGQRGATRAAELLEPGDPHHRVDDSPLRPLIGAGCWGLLGFGDLLWRGLLSTP